MSRERSPKYTVMRKVSTDDPKQSTTLTVVAENVPAATRKEAIVKAAQGLPEEERYGTFVTVLSASWRVLERQAKQETLDVWG